MTRDIRASAARIPRTTPMAWAMTATKIVTATPPRISPSGWKIERKKMLQSYW